jgi:hypothetical protein
VFFTAPLISYFMNVMYHLKQYACCPCDEVWRDDTGRSVSVERVFRSKDHVLRDYAHLCNHRYLASHFTSHHNCCKLVPLPSTL